MTSYTVEFEYTSQLIEASDTDMAHFKSIEASGLSAEDRGELLSITVHHEAGDDKYLTAKGQQDPFATGKRMTAGEKPEAPKPVKLPSRRQGGLTLSYQDGDLFVTSFGYSASLACAFHEEELQHDKGRHEPKQLSAKQMRIVSEWMDCEGDYYDRNGWKTFGEIYG